MRGLDGRRATISVAALVRELSTPRKWVGAAAIVMADRPPLPSP